MVAILVAIVGGLVLICRCLWKKLNQRRLNQEIENVSDCVSIPISILKEEEGQILSHYVSALVGSYIH